MPKKGRGANRGRIGWDGMPETRTIALGSGRTLHAAAAGRGPDLVLVHGAITTHRDWLTGPFPFERLARDFLSLIHI